MESNFKSKKKKSDRWNLYDLKNDPSETNDIASEQLAILATMIEFAKTSHQPARPGTFIDPSEVDTTDRQAKLFFRRQ